jgi:undecaprenyl-diphosphatase
MLFDYLEQVDRSIVLTVNGWYSPFLDEFFWWISKTAVWIPVYLIALFFLYKNYGAKIALIGVFFAIGMIAIVDTSTTFLFKETIQRYRPSHHTELSKLLHFYVKSNGKPYLGGEFGFFSSHASNNFAVATFLSLLLRNRYKWFVPIAFFCASLIAFSRLYLGVHYLSDLICGALWGMLWASLFYRLFQHFVLKLK